jgi:small subunit ribosomal protein S21
MKTGYFAQENRSFFSGNLISVHDNDIGSALRRLKKVVQREGIKREQKRDRFYIPKSEERRQAKIEARKRFHRSQKKARQS